MHLNALLDLDVVAVETRDHISVLIDLVAPARATAAPRPPATLQVVLDRSGSMADGRLAAAAAGLRALVDRLDPTDNFGLVTFDDTVEVVVPAGPLTDRAGVTRAIAAIPPGGMTDLGGGLLRGMQEARRVKGDAGATLVLLSDGQANRGITAHDDLERVAAMGRAAGVTVSTIGIGLGYDEELMAAVARGGAGDAAFAEEPDAAGAALAAQVDGLLEQVVQAANLVVRPAGAVTSVRLVNDLPASLIPGGFMVELGDFHSGEERRLLLEIDVPAMAALGVAQVCELTLQWVDVATLDSHTVTVPISVNVVPGDQAAGRVPDATVRTELGFQRAQRAKREAADALRRGDVGRASDVWHDAQVELGSIAAVAPPAMSDEIIEEMQLLGRLADEARHEDPRRMAKFSEADRHAKERKRGRRPRPGDGGGRP